MHVIASTLVFFPDVRLVQSRLPTNFWNDALTRARTPNRMIGACDITSQKMFQPVYLVAR